MSTHLIQESASVANYVVLDRLQFLSATNLPYDNDTSRLSCIVFVA